MNNWSGSAVAVEIHALVKFSHFNYYQWSLICKRYTCNHCVARKILFFEVPWLHHWAAFTERSVDVSCHRATISDIVGVSHSSLGTQLNKDQTRAWIGFSYRRYSHILYKFLQTLSITSLAKKYLFLYCYKKLIIITKHGDNNIPQSIIRRDKNGGVDFE